MVILEAPPPFANNPSLKHDNLATFPIPVLRTRPPHTQKHTQSENLNLSEQRSIFLPEHA